MSFQRIWAMFVARNYEFFRDRAALGWNFIFPILIVAGFAVIFGGNTRDVIKVGVFPIQSERIKPNQLAITPKFTGNNLFSFIGFENQETAVNKLKHHKIDFLVKNGSPTDEYWVTETSHKGKIAEQIFNSSLVADEHENPGNRKKITGIEIRYIDWVFPGILAMNMMFSSLFGVGYIIVRYRKNGVLKRFKTTPLNAIEYLTAQMFSRIFVLMSTLIIVWIGCDLIFSFHTVGSYLSLLFIFFLGGLSLISLGLILAARGTSEEFTSGIINFITWPMMFLSEVWFSLEGSPEWVKAASNIFPLTHMLKAARAIMNDGAGLVDVRQEILILTSMFIICLIIGASMFSWDE